MPVFKRNAKVTEKFEVSIDGGADKFELSFRKMNVPEMLEFHNQATSISREISESGLTAIPKASYEKMLYQLIDLVDEIYGFTDEDNKALSWADLSEHDRYEIFAMVDVDSVVNAWSHAATVGRLKEDEKKV